MAPFDMFWLQLGFNKLISGVVNMDAAISQLIDRLQNDEKLSMRMFNKK